MTMFHGFYDQWMYHPFVVFDSRGFPAAVLLRPGNAHDSWEAVAVLEQVIRWLWEAWTAMPSLPDLPKFSRSNCVNG